MAAVTVGEASQIRVFEYVADGSAARVLANHVRDVAVCRDVGEESHDAEAAELLRRGEIGRADDRAREAEVVRRVSE
jgi:hypothetical protein